jgi:hypothetical protein
VDARDRKIAKYLIGTPTLIEGVNMGGDADSLTCVIYLH